MTLEELIEVLKTPDHVDPEDVLKMEVKFMTEYDGEELELLSVYEHNGQIFIDIGK